MNASATASAKTVLVLGGASDIARATAAVFAENGWSVRLAGRNPEALGRERDDIAARTGATVTAHAFDALDASRFAAFVDGLPELPSVVICAVGLLGDQIQAQTDLDLAALTMRSNYEGPSLILGLIAEQFLARGSGVHRRRVLGGGRPGAGVELRLWLGEGRVHRLPVGAEEPVRPEGRARGDGEAGIRPNEDDRGDEAAATADRRTARDRRGNLSRDRRLRQFRLSAVDLGADHGGDRLDPGTDLQDHENLSGPLEGRPDGRAAAFARFDGGRSPSLEVGSFGMLRRLSSNALSSIFVVGSLAIFALCLIKVVVSPAVSSAAVGGVGSPFNYHIYQYFADAANHGYDIFHLQPDTAPKPDDPRVVAKYLDFSR